jgi:long-chain acyl-CoA synthetase
MPNPSKPWLQSYPDGVPHTIGEFSHASLVEMLEESFAKFPNRNACEYLGKFMTYRELDQQSRNFAAYLQTLGLKTGSRIAIMLPNVMQFQIAMMGALRAGLVVVNVNPLYTSRELEYQLKDSGASALIILENFAHVYQKIAQKVSVKKVIVTSLGEFIGTKGKVVDFVVRYIKKVVPPWNLPQSICFKEALKIGASSSYLKPPISIDDIAFLQYTGGTTGVSKGAVLLHRNILANAKQIEVWLEPGLKGKQIDQMIFLCALPLYHIFALTACAIFGARIGAMLIMVPNPRDIPGFIKLLKSHPNIHIFPGVNTLFNALIHRPEFSNIKLPNLLVTIGGGMAMQKVVADEWQRLTGVPIAEGYGLSETSPVACVNTPLIQSFTGHVGLPVPGTEVMILGDNNIELPLGQAGEICIKGPQVMTEYWNMPEETRNAFTSDGYFRSGDIGLMDENGFVKIIDRKKDMIIVSGFKVYPNEVEEVLSEMPGILECAVIGTADEETGEAVKAFIVKSDADLSEDQVLDYCKQQLTNYKRPKKIIFRTDLPKTNVGKILRRELRD